MIRNIIFDFGKVLIDYNVFWLLDELLGNHDKAVWFNENVTAPAWQRDTDRENKPWESSISDLKLRWPSYAETIEAFDRRYQKMIGSEIEGMNKLLTELKEKGFRLWGLSNWSSKVYETIRSHNIFRLLDGWLISSEVHLLKPEKAIYHSFLQKFHLAAPDCIFIDDRRDNVEGAMSVGIKSLQFTDAPTLRRELIPLLPKVILCKAQRKDLNSVWHIVHEAALSMVEKGRRQWDCRYPARTDIEQDFSEKKAYVLKVNDNVTGYLSLSFNEEPAYDHLRGRWLTDGPYAVIHRMAVCKEQQRQGWGCTLLRQTEVICRQKYRSIRVDTNYDNMEMLHLLKSMGYKQCGTVNYMRFGSLTERIAFEKTL